MIAIGFVLLMVAFIVAFIAEAIAHDPHILVKAVVVISGLIGIGMLIAGVAKWLWEVAP